MRPCRSLKSAGPVDGSFLDHGRAQQAAQIFFSRPAADFETVPVLQTVQSWQGFPFLARLSTRFGVPIFASQRRPDHEHGRGQGRRWPGPQRHHLRQAGPLDHRRSFPGAGELVLARELLTPEGRSFAVMLAVVASPLLDAFIKERTLSERTS